MNHHTAKLIVFFFCIFITNYYYFILFIKDEKHLLHIYDRRSHLDLIHFQALYPSLPKKNQGEDESLLKKQEAIGICVNFNFDPDTDGNTLGSILPFYTTINKYVAILTPSSFSKFFGRNLELFNQFNVTLILIDNQTLSKSHLSFIDDRINTTSTVYYIECIDGSSGQLQHKCLLLCVQFYARLKIEHSTLRGILYTADDLYFNFAYVFSHPERFSLDEVWTVPWMQLVDISTNDKGRLGNTWWWWKNKPHLWNSFRDFFLTKSKISEKYRRIFQILYGSNKRLAVGIADLVYLPFADDQLATFISITNELMTLLPSDMFCEIIFPLLVDTTMALCGHWPFENDREMYNSSVNHLNNLSTIQQMERMNFIKNARNPYSLNNSFRQRPCLFNPDGFIWDHNRQNRQLFETTIINGTVPIMHLSKPWPYRTEFLHPMKLSNDKQWAFQLWHHGMQQQIEQLKKYQTDKLAVR
ncbi:unnamed protein product [Rotaria sp. Silwood2]|nr:unnamed protein product [Rotaria sp. Silwood2]CAF4081407.1 unnamed protein product [Rotaria sp. Silwood2]